MFGSPEMPEPGDFDQPAFGYLFNTIGKIIDLEVASALKAFHLEPRMLGSMSTVERLPDLQYNDYAKVLVYDPLTFGRLVDRLVEKGLVGRTQLADRRANGLKLTDEGSVMLAKTSDIALRIERSFLTKLSRQAIEDLRKSMRKILMDIRSREGK